MGLEVSCNPIAYIMFQSCSVINSNIENIMNLQDYRKEYTYMYTRCPNPSEPLAYSASYIDTALRATPPLKYVFRNCLRSSPLVTRCLVCSFGGRALFPLLPPRPSHALSVAHQQPKKTESTSIWGKCMYVCSSHFSNTCSCIASP